MPVIKFSVYSERLLYSHMLDEYCGQKICCNSNMKKLKCKKLLSYIILLSSTGTPEKQARIKHYALRITKNIKNHLKI